MSTEHNVQTDGEVHAVIEKSPDQVIVVQRKEFKGHDLVDVRIFYAADSEDEMEIEWRPTRKGIAFNIEQLDDVIEGLQKAQGSP